MLNFKKHLAGGVAAIFSLSASPVVWAGAPTGGQMNYGPGGLAPSSIPTLNGLMLVVLALVLATIAFRVLRKHGSQYLSVGILGLAALVSGYSGVSLISEAHAQSWTYSMDNPAGGTIAFESYWVNIFENDTNIPLRVQDINITDCPDFPTGQTYPDGPECSVGLTIAPAMACVIDCGSPPAR